MVRRVHALFWTRMAGDGLLGPAADLAWLIDTTSILAATETHLLVTRMTGWTSTPTSAGWAEPSAS